ncbi:hypothetical protein BV898_16819 [Hypsibius exemplaris]|uniref:G-protein coupled receptors family 1 profile domain-containing protein n=1 Tax=Hypsibius exemplaris TaxID=2072580 RepID=A0A9X6NFL6_HYPEX|nr:hypothetical protein BV898_16819 [Hypsibius exemplaris]
MEEPDLPRWGTGLFSILILLTITANLLVIASFLSEPRLLKHHFNLYLLNLAVTDLLMYDITPFFGDFLLSSEVECSKATLWTMRSACDQKLSILTVTLKTFYLDDGRGDR